MCKDAFLRMPWRTTHNVFLFGLKGEGQSILVIDKNVGELIKLADRHHIVEKGRIVWSGTSTELARDRDLQHRYLGV